MEKCLQVRLVIYRAEGADEPHRIELLIAEADRFFQADQVHAGPDAAFFDALVGNRKSRGENDIRSVLLDVCDHRVDVAFFDIAAFHEVFGGFPHRVAPVRAFDVELNVRRREEMVKSRGEEVSLLIGFAEETAHNLSETFLELVRLVRGNFVENRTDLFHERFRRTLLRRDSRGQIAARAEGVDLAADADVIFVVEHRGHDDVVQFAVFEIDRRDNEICGVFRQLFRLVRRDDVDDLEVEMFLQPREKQL